VERAEQSCSVLEMFFGGRFMLGCYNIALNLFHLFKLHIFHVGSFMWKAATWGRGGRLPCSSTREKRLGERLVGNMVHC
jgi:hypothetical protein